MATSSAIAPAQRYTRARRCLICDGYENMRRGKGERCAGYLSRDGLYAYCTREKYAGALAPNPHTAPLAWAHRLGGPCKCGATHPPAPGAPEVPAPRAPRADRSYLTIAAPVAPIASEEASQEGDPGEWLVQWRKPAGEWIYRDSAGAPVHKVVRYPVVNTRTGECDKTYVPYHPIPGRRKWEKGLGEAPCIPYRLPELLASDPGASIYLCEGEKCTEAVAAAGLVATTTISGSSSWAKSAGAMCQALAGRHVVIVPDNDRPGARYAEAAAASLAPVAASVRVVTLAGLPEKGDIADWLGDGHTGEELAALAHAAPVWAPAPEPETRERIEEGAARNTRRPARALHPPRTRLPLLAATPEQNARMVWLDVSNYYTTADRDYLYTYVSPRGEEEGEELAGEEEGERGGYYKPVHAWGMPRLVGTYRVDLGGERLRDEVIYQIEWSTQPEAGVHEVTGEKLADGSCWSHWPGLPISSRRERDTYANIVKAQILAFDILVIEGYTATGLHQDSRTGAWAYLLPDGRCIGEEGAISSIPLHGYSLARRRALAFSEQMPALPAPAPDRDRVRELLAFYARVSPHGHLAITVGAALRSMISSLVPAATALLAEGPAGSGKTSSNTHARGVIGPSPFHSEADAQFNATATYVEQTLAPLRDVPAVIDNFRIKPTDTPADIRVVADILDRVIIAAESGNAMRGRGGRAGKPQKGNHIETLPLINGEAIPPALVSTLRRVMHLPYAKGVDVDVDIMEAQEASYQPILTGIGHTVLRCLLAALNHDAGELRGRIERQEGEYTRRLMAAIHEAPPEGEIYRSIPENWARVLTGWWLAQVALDMDPGEESGTDGELIAAVYPHVVRWMLAQMRLAAQGGPAHITAEWVRSATLTAFESGMMHALDRAGAPLIQTELTGVLSDYGYARTTQSDWITRGPYGAILDSDAGILYIKTRVWERALADLAARQSRERGGQGPQWTYNAQTFAGAMLRLGVTIPNPRDDIERPATCVLWVAGKSDRFAAVRLADLYGDPDTSPIGESENSGKSGKSGKDIAPAQNTTGPALLTASECQMSEAVRAVRPGVAAIDAYEGPRADVIADSMGDPDDTGWPDDSAWPGEHCTYDDPGEEREEREEREIVGVDEL